MSILFYTSTAFLLSWLRAIKVFLISTFLPPIWIVGVALGMSKMLKNTGLYEFFAILLFGYFLNIIAVLKAEGYKDLERK